jgi:hypothetical protein
LFRDEIALTDFSPKEKASFSSGFDGFVDANYEEEIQYFAYSEWRAFIDEVLRRANDKGFTDDLLKQMLEQRRAGIALVGELRTDYEKSKEMVRNF